MSKLKNMPPGNIYVLALCSKARDGPYHPLDITFMNFFGIFRVFGVKWFRKTSGWWKFQKFWHLGHPSHHLGIYKRLSFCPFFALTIFRPSNLHHVWSGFLDLILFWMVKITVNKWLLQEMAIFLFAIQEIFSQTDVQYVSVTCGTEYAYYSRWA